MTTKNLIKYFHTACACVSAAACLIFFTGCYNPYETDTAGCCTDGYYCNDAGKCWQQCNLDSECASGYECTEGLCQAKPGWVPPDDDAGDTGEDAGTDAGTDDSGAGDSGTSPDAA